ncbi:MAG: hypothetical protein ACI4GX_07870 [Ruminococcus sp.]|uniref:hypothetical protein n=1 Tax=Ruminococcus sp. TaxID=41978 RepID=UPI003F114451
MEAIKFIRNNFAYMGTFLLSQNGDWYGSALENDFCLNWWYKEEERKIEINLFTPLPDDYLDYNKMQEILAKRFAKSDKVSKVMRVGARRIDVYLN